MATIDPADITTTEAILHLLDPEDGGFKPSERTLPLGEAVATFLARHVAHSLSDSQIKGARFVASGHGTAPAILQRLVGEGDFVGESAALANRAYEVMVANKSIRPPGTLAIVRYSKASTPEIRRVAVLKLDKGGKFRRVPRTDDAGKSYWDLEETGDTVPSSDERLHKAAFVGPLDLTSLTGLDSPNASEPSDNGKPVVAGGAEHQFLVLDRQVAAGAEWWISKFLLATLALTDEDRAERWHKGVLAAKNRVQDRLDNEQRAAFDLAIRSGISSEVLKVNEWMEALAIPPELKTEVRAEIDMRLPDNEFTVQPDIRKKYSKHTWAGDNGLRVTIDAESLHLVDPKPVDGGWEITIKTSRWEQIK